MCDSFGKLLRKKLHIILHGVCFELSKTAKLPWGAHVIKEAHSPRGFAFPERSGRIKVPNLSHMFSEENWHTRHCICMVDEPKKTVQELLLKSRAESYGPYRRLTKRV